jgi:hypothetical protein
LRHPAILLAIPLILAGCGSSQPGRTSGGMAAGAGTGALIGLIGGPIGVVVGAAVGAGAGALTATNTAPKAVNLGDPLWQRSKGVQAPPTGAQANAYAGGGLPPPQPLNQSAPGVAPMPSAGAVPLSPDAPIQSQPRPSAR